LLWHIVTVSWGIIYHTTILHGLGRFTSLENWTHI
jgi:hypothetical protein